MSTWSTILSTLGDLHKLSSGSPQQPGRQHPVLSQAPIQMGAPQVPQMQTGAGQMSFGGGPMPAPGQATPVSLSAILGPQPSAGQMAGLPAGGTGPFGQAGGMGTPGGPSMGAAGANAPAASPLMLQQPQAAGAGGALGALLGGDAGGVIPPGGAIPGMAPPAPGIAGGGAPAGIQGAFGGGPAGAPGVSSIPGLPPYAPGTNTQMQGPQNVIGSIPGLIINAKRMMDNRKQQQVANQVSLWQAMAQDPNPKVQEELKRQLNDPKNVKMMEKAQKPDSPEFRGVQQADQQRVNEQYQQQMYQAYMANQAFNAAKKMYQPVKAWDPKTKSWQLSDMSEWQQKGLQNAVPISETQLKADQLNQEQFNDIQGGTSAYLAAAQNFKYDHKDTDKSAMQIVLNDAGISGSFAKLKLGDFGQVEVPVISSMSEAIDRATKSTAYSGLSQNAKDLIDAYIRMGSSVPSYVKALTGVGRYGAQITQLELRNIPDPTYNPDDIISRVNKFQDRISDSAGGLTQSPGVPSLQDMKEKYYTSKLSEAARKGSGMTTDTSKQSPDVLMDPWEYIKSMAIGPPPVMPQQPPAAQAAPAATPNQTQAPQGAPFQAPVPSAPPSPAAGPRAAPQLGPQAPSGAGMPPGPQGGPGYAGLPQPVAPAQTDVQPSAGGPQAWHANIVGPMTRPKDASPSAVGVGTFSDGDWYIDAQGKRIAPYKP